MEKVQDTDIFLKKLRLNYMILIKKKNNEEFEVQLKYKVETKHQVFFSETYFSKFQGKNSKIQIIRKSFEFLLQRESNEQILTKFNLEIINNYFPDYEKEFKIK